jgi:hypothetical protein
MSKAWSIAAPISFKREFQSISSILNYTSRFTQYYFISHKEPGLSGLPLRAYKSDPMPTDEEVIDLTFTEDEDEEQPDSKRRRTRYDNDDEVIIVEGHAAAPQPNEPETANQLGDDEVMLVSANGIEVCVYERDKKLNAAVQCTL